MAFFLLPTSPGYGWFPLLTSSFPMAAQNEMRSDPPSMSSVRAIRFHLRVFRHLPRQEN